MFKKVPYQKKKNFIKKLKMPYHKTYKIPQQKTSSRILKSALSCLKKIPYQKDTLSKRYLIKKIPYQKKTTHQESKTSALSKNLQTSVKSDLSRIYTKYLKTSL